MQDDTTYPGSSELVNSGLEGLVDGGTSGGPAESAPPFGRDAAGGARWSKDISRRSAVFESKGACMRSGISYNAALKRYLWCQVLPVGSPRFKGGFGVYDAPEPWGPWTTVLLAKQWDVGPGETCSFPTKWMSPDGRTVHLVFSGEDAFSVRRATLTVPKKK